MQGKKSLVAFDSMEINAENDEFKDSDEDEALAEDSPQESDSDEERRRSSFVVPPRYIFLL